MSAKKEETPIHQSPAVVDFNSPVVLSYLSISTDLDREIVRSLALFGESDSFKDICKRNPAYSFLDTSVKTAARNRRRYLLKIQKQDPAKFEQLCSHYAIHNNKSIDLSSSFNRVSDPPPDFLDLPFIPPNLNEENKKKMSLVVHNKARGKYIIKRRCCCFILKSYLPFLSCFLLH